MSSGEAAKRTVFLVHGRDDQARASLDALLRAFDLKVLSWRQASALAGGGSPYTGDIVAAGIKHADAVVVLLTPDDVGYLRPKFLQDRDGPDERNPTGQPRLNVVFEAGMAMAQKDKKVVLVEVGTVRQISDIADVNVVRLDDRIERRKDLAERLRSAGLTIDMEYGAWWEAGSFAPATLGPPDLVPAGSTGRSTALLRVPDAATPAAPVVAATDQVTAPVTSAKDGGTVKQRAYLTFWPALLNRIHADETLVWARLRARVLTRNWMVLETRESGSFVVGFVSGARLRCEYYIDIGDGDANLRLLRELETSQAGIEGLFGGPLSWEELPGKRACRVAAYTDGDVTNSARHGEYIEWFASTANRLRDAIGPRVS